MQILWLDFETRSRCDLKAHGVYNYAQDASTEVLCMSYAFDDEDVVTWLPGQPFPERVAQHKGLIYAHNAAFERLIFWYVLQIDFALEQFYCTAAQARSNCAPGSLEDVGRFASASMRKDHRGSQLIRLLCIPRADGTFNQDSALMAEMVAYCEMDVKAMRAISKAMRPLSADELADYHVNERINDRGVLVDVELCEAAMRYSAAELEDIQQIVAEVTEGAITSVRSPKMRQWVQDRVGPEALKLMTVHKDGVAKMSIDKTVRANLLALAEENPDEIPPSVADVIQCADDLWASSTAKFSRFKSMADFEGGRIRGAFVFAGGAATGRASSYGVQLHNLPRKCAKQPDDVRRSMVRGHDIVAAFGGRATDILKSMLRPALVPAEGWVFAVADLRQIEARVTPWLADAEDILDVFRNGEDIYVKAAQGIFHTTEVTPNQRQVGKAASLSCSFGGGHNAFAAMGKIYGVDLPEAEAMQTVAAWRRANPWAVRMWYDLENAAATAMRHKGHEIPAAKVTYMYDGSSLWYALPSGRILVYPYVRFDEDGGISYAKAAWKPAADAKEWPRARLYRSVLLENIVQATAHDILRGALRQLDGVVLHAHDEIVIECEASTADAALANLCKVLTTPPDWCKTLPLEVDAKIMTRYGK